MQNIELEYKVERFDCDGVARYIVFRRRDCASPVSSSLYEAYLHARRKPKKGTSGTVMQHLVFLFSWADFDGFDLEAGLFSGVGLQLPEIQRFFNWLDCRCYRGNKISDSYVAHIVGDCKRFVLWFVRRYLQAVEGEPLNITIHKVVAAHREAWSEIEIKIESDIIAADIPDAAYQKIEKFFKPENYTATELKPTRLRNYIMWRLAWEFGLRIGEILSMRTVDVDLITVPQFIRIVRLDERMKNEADPRCPNQPKVKTLSRELGFLEPDTLLPSLLEIYINKKRTRYFNIYGKDTETVFLGHDYLFVVHDGTGRPLSCSAAQKISIDAAKKSGQSFNWHLARHAFFNRRYVEVSKSSESVILIDNLIYWGGWKSEESLKRYVRRAIRDNARSGLKVMNEQFVNNGVDS